jgi:ABC-type Mn2+/Zn2+ transport system permease subunit
LAIALANRDEAIGSDLGVAVVVTTLFGAGALLALSPEVPARLGSILFGDPLSISGADLALSAALAAAVLFALVGEHRSLSLSAFDRAAAPNLGARPARADVALLVLIALTTLVAVQALGNLLVVALLIGPGAAALRLRDRLVPALVLSAAIAIGCGIAGLYASYYLDLATGAAIALSAVLVFVASIVVRARPQSSSRVRSPIEALGAQR